jgi:hypothetical protein
MTSAMYIRISQKFIICALLGAIVVLSHPQQTSQLELKLRRDIQDRTLEDFSLIQAAFILSGATQPDSLNRYLDWYDQLIQTIKDFHFDYFDRIGTAAKIFSYLHETWLITYKEEATTLIDVVKEKKFNCVAGTILYNLVCDELNFPTEAFETPTHTYTLFPNFTERTIIVENTRKSGFDILTNLREQSRYLLQFYPGNEAAQIGYDRIYEYENSKGRQIDNTELLGLLAYNRAYFAEKIKDYKDAYNFVLLAQKFNNDSRSNINFEIGLYYQWGNSLFNQREYDKAFYIFKNAYSRYWQNKDFMTNCLAAFFNSMIMHRQTDNWPQAHELLKEMQTLNILNDKDSQSLQLMLKEWLMHEYRLNETKTVLEMMQDMEKYSLADDDVKLLKKKIDSNQ